MSRQHEWQIVNKLENFQQIKKSSGQTFKKLVPKNVRLLFEYYIAIFIIIGKQGKKFLHLFPLMKIKLFDFLKVLLNTK